MHPVVADPHLILTLVSLALHHTQPFIKVKLLHDIQRVDCIWAVIGSGADVPESQICDSVIWKTTAVCMHVIMH